MNGLLQRIIWLVSKMHRKKSPQTTLLDNPICFGGVRLDTQNAWVKLSELIPRDVLDEKYGASFENPEKENPAKASRMALGSHIIKERYGFSDEDNGGTSEVSGNEGTLILDATCAPSDIRFPTDVSLLNECREKLEGIIDELHTPGTPKP